LDLIEQLYARDGKNQIGSQSDHSEFYGYISSIKRSSSIAEWQAFRQKLYSSIAKVCERLEKRSVPELHPDTKPSPHQDITAHSPRSHASFSSENSSRSPESSPSPTLHTEHARPSAMNERPPPIRQTSAPVQTQTVPQNDMNILDFTSLLKEHVDREGGILIDRNVMVSSEPRIWRWMVTWGKLSSEGEGRNKKQARNAASRNMFFQLGLSVD
jgi:hypothetical protein